MPIDYTRRDRRPGGRAPAPARPPAPEPVPYTEPGPTPMPDPSPWLGHLHDPAQATLERITRVIARRLRLRYLELPPGPLGLGVGVAIGDTDFVVVSASGGDKEHVSLSCGVLRDVRRDRLLVLDSCNRLTQDRPAYPFYLHDAEIGWDVLLQTSFPAQLLQEAPDFLRSLLIGLPDIARDGREKLLANQVGGVAYEWAPADLQRLLIRSMM